MTFENNIAKYWQVLIIKLIKKGLLICIIKKHIHDKNE